MCLQAGNEDLLVNPGNLVTFLHIYMAIGLLMYNAYLHIKLLVLSMHNLLTSTLISVDIVFSRC